MPYVTVKVIDSIPINNKIHLYYSSFPLPETLSQTWGKSHYIKVLLG